MCCLLLHGPAEVYVQLLCCFFHLILDILDILATTLLPNNQPNPNETSLHHFRTTAPSMHHNQLGKCLSTESSTITFEV